MDDIKKITRAPIVVFVYNRLQCTIKTLEALGKNILAEESELFIFSDAAKTKEDIEKVRAVREYIAEYRKQCRFAKVTEYYAERNKGLANSVIDGVTKIITQYGRAIVLEDDCVPTEDFLKYINEALDFYKSNLNIWSISGYAYEFDSLKDYPHDIYMAWRGCSWGWATWEDRWKQVDWNVQDYKKFRFSIKKRLKFMRGGNDLPTMLKAQMNGKIDSWAVRWYYMQSKLDKYTVYPKLSRINNIGFDSGVHGTEGMMPKEENMLSNVDECCIFENLEIDKKLEKEMQLFNKLTIKSRIMGFIKLQRRVRKMKNEKYI